MIFIAKGQDEIYLASGYRLRSRSAEVSMQIFLRSLLSADAADITGLISGKVKYYVEKLSVKQILSVHEAFRKLGHVPLEDGTKNALEQYIYICLIVSQKQPLKILLG